MRNVAYHTPLFFLNSAVPEEIDGVLYFRLKGGRIVKRVHIWGNVVGKFSGDEFVRYTLDDLTGSISVVFFGEDADRYGGAEVGDRVDVVGRLRMRDDEVGVVGETLKIIGPDVELLRRVENMLFILGVPESVEITPPVPQKKEEETEEEEVYDVETIDLGGDDEW